MTPMELTTAQRQLLGNIAEQNGFIKYKLNIVPGSVKGDNFMGVITSVTIEEGDRRLELIMKSAQGGEFRNHMPIHQAYLREIFVYENVFNKFKEFQEEYGIKDPFQAYAKLYGSCKTEGSECFVLENLRDSGYSMWNRKIPMNPHHLTAVVKEYAKFHAASLAMMTKEPETFRELIKDMRSSVFEDYFDDISKNMMFAKAVMVDVYKVFEDDPGTTEVLKSFEEKLPETLAKMTQQPEEVVIEHGDCWCNNLMFAYKNPREPFTPTNVSIIDWQVTKLGSPVTDIVNFVLANSSKDLLYSYKDFLKIYYNTLCINLRSFSCDIETTFSFDTLLRHWNDRVGIGIYTTFYVLKIMLSSSDEAPDFTKIGDDGNTISNVISFEMKNTGEYNRRMKDLVEFCINNDFL